jgi:hypothetical protein
MKVKVDDLEVLVRDIKYGDYLRLLGHYQDVFNSEIEGGKGVKHQDVYDLLAHTSEIAFQNPEKDFKSKYDMAEQTNILTQCMMDYLELSDKSKKVDGD